MKINTVNIGAGEVSRAILSRRLHFLAICAGVAMFMATPTTASAAGDVNAGSCPSSTESSPGFSSGLPDCRAYELVSQANTYDLGNITEPYGFPEGEHFVYDSWLPVPGSGAGAGVPENFLATRTASGWRQTAISVPQGEGPTELTLGVQGDAEGVDFTGGFADALVMSPFQDPLEAPRLNESAGVMVYDVSLDGGGVSTVSLPDSGPVTQSLIEFPAIYGIDGTAQADGWGMFLQGASENGSRVFFLTSARLATALGTPQDTHQAGSEVYERTGGHTYLVGVLPDGEVPVCGASVGQGLGGSGGGGQNYEYGAIAPDGSNVVFQTPGQEPVGGSCVEKETGVFLRDTVNGTTRKLPGSGYIGRAGVGAGEEEKIFTAGTGGSIYEYHLASERVVEVASEADALLAWSADGSRVYYLGPEEGMYLYEEGASKAKLIPGTEKGGYKTGYEQSLRAGGAIETKTATNSNYTANMPVATPDGSELLFVSPVKLDKKYENCAIVEVAGGTFEKRCHYEAYLYDAASGRVTCVSCGGAPASGDASLIDHGFSVSGKDFGYRPSAEPLIYSHPAEAGREAVMRVVFETTEGLVPQDTNGTMDVYEWEQEETEGCSTHSLGVASLEESPAYSARDEGCLYLLTSGTGQEVPNELGIIDGSHLVGASEDLRDIYIQTPDALLPGVDNTTHIYDVRVDGGFPYTPESEGCEPGLCRNETPAGSSFQTPASIVFDGPGNPATTNTSPAPITPAKTKKTKAVLSRQKKLNGALRACKHRPAARRGACEAAAKRRYAALKPKHAKKPTRGGKR